MRPSSMHWRYTACVAGITMQRTSGCTVRPRSTSAAWRVFDGRCGNDTVGTMEAASISYTFAYVASASEWYSV